MSLEYAFERVLSKENIVQVSNFSAKLEGTQYSNTIPLLVPVACSYIIVYTRAVLWL